MATTLADLTRQAAKLIVRMVSGTTTALGTTTTLIDTVGLAAHPDDNFNGGTVWFTSGTYAGKTRPITDFVDSTDTLTFAALPGAVASGVSWEACDSSVVEYADLRQAVQLALREIGKIIAWDATTVAGAEQLIYNLPAGVKDVVGVEVITDIGLASEFAEINTHFLEVDGELRFERNRAPAEGLTIRIAYLKFHTEMTVDTDALSDQICEEYLVYMAARQAMRMAYKRFGKAGKEEIPEWLNEAIEETKKHIKPNMHVPMIQVRTA